MEPKDGKNESVLNKKEKAAEFSKILTIALCAGFIVLEVLKQTTTYGTKELHNDTYPIHSTSIVFFTELCKFLSCFVLYILSTSTINFTPSFIFAVPSILYTANNNLYLYALTFMPPPTWNILLQSRIIMTALVYRFILKREIGTMRWAALWLLFVAISLAEFSGAVLPSSDVIGYKGLHLNPTTTLVGLTGAAISTIASITIEYLYKNNQRPFLEQQLQLYLFSGIVAFLWSLYSTNGHPLATNGSFSQLDGVLVTSTIILGGCGGLTVAFIVKKVDNIAKIYSVSISIILTAFICAVIFPKEFELKFQFVIALGLMFISLVLYEIGHTSPILTPFKASISSNASRWMLSATLLLFVFSSLMATYVDNVNMSNFKYKKAPSVSVTRFTHRQLHNVNMQDFTSQKPHNTSTQLTKKITVSQGKEGTVPNIIHYMWTDMDKPLEFHHYLSIKSAKKIAKPDTILFHTLNDQQPKGTYWDKLKKIPEVKITQFKNKTQIPNTNNDEDTDLAIKLHILQEHGGIFLDTDFIILKPLDKFRRYEFVVSREFYDIQTSIIFSAPSSSVITDFLRKVQTAADQESMQLLQSFRSFVEINLNTIYVEENHFLRHDLVSIFEFNHNIFFDKVDISDNYGLKLYYEMYGKHLFPHEVNLMDTTFGEIARDIYFGSKALRYPPPRQFIPTTFAVPNVIRYVWFEERQFNFIDYLSVMSALKFQKPDSVVFYIKTNPQGELWTQTTERLGDKLKIVVRDPAKLTSGKFMKNLVDAAQLASLDSLKDGGIFLQTDVILLRSLDHLRHYDFTIAMEVDNKCRIGLHPGIMLAREKAKMTDVLHKAFEENHMDDPHHLGRVMLGKAKAHPDWLHIEPVSLTRPDWSDWWLPERIWHDNYPGEMNKTFAMHLLCGKDCDKYTLKNSEHHNSTFGDIVRHVLNGEDLFKKLL